MQTLARTTEPSSIACPSPVGRAQVASEWRRLGHLVTPALERFGGTHTPGDVLAVLLKGDAQLWASENAILITEVIAYPRARTCRAWLAGGDLREIVAMEPGIAEWARRERNCRRAEIIGRDGWERALDGYERVCAVLVKDL